MYSLTRGLLTVSILLIPASVICLVLYHPRGHAFTTLVISLAAAVLLAHRFVQFANLFADQVWHDFAALPAPTPPATT